MSSSLTFQYLEKKNRKIWKIEKLRETNVENLGKKLFDKNDPNSGVCEHVTSSVVMQLRHVFGFLYYCLFVFMYSIHTIRSTKPMQIIDILEMSHPDLQYRRKRVGRPART